MLSCVSGGWKTTVDGNPNLPSCLSPYLLLFAVVYVRLAEPGVSKSSLVSPSHLTVDVQVLQMWSTTSSLTSILGNQDLLHTYMEGTLTNNHPQSLLPLCLWCLIIITIHTLYISIKCTLKNPNVSICSKCGRLILKSLLRTASEWLTCQWERILEFVHIL